MATKIDTVTARTSLKARREPYWHRITKGSYLGFRKMSASADGTWIARAMDEANGKKIYKSFGDFAATPDHRRFDAASKAAQEWFDHLGKGGSVGPATVRVVCARYVAHLKSNKKPKAASDAETRFNNYVLDNPKLANADVMKLTPAMLDAWRKGLQARPTTSGPNRGKPRTDSTLNRDLTSFRAALNLAYVDCLVTSDFAWRGKLRPIEGADRSRELYLDRDQRRKFIESAPDDLAAFLRGLSLLPLRPGALAALTVSSFDKRTSVLTIGKDKAGGDRKLKLPLETADFFAAQTQGKLPNAPLLARVDGKPWDKDAWKWPVKAASVAAKLPEGTTAYTLRHSTISDLVHDGLDLLTVAQISGTSVRMIEQHYGHLRGDVAADALAKLAL